MTDPPQNGPPRFDRESGPACAPAALATASRSLRARLPARLLPVRPRLLRRIEIWLWALLLVWGAARVLAVGLRYNYKQLGLSLLLGPSLIELIVGVLVLHLAVRQATPGRTRAPSFLLATGAGLVALQLAMAALTRWRVQVPVRAEVFHDVWRHCLGYQSGLGLPFALLAAVLLWRGVARRGPLIGLVAGLAAGMVADGLWRLNCPFTAWDHVLQAHGGALGLTVLVAVAAAGLVTLGQRLASS